MWYTSNSTNRNTQKDTNVYMLADKHGLGDVLGRDIPEPNNMDELNEQIQVMEVLIKLLRKHIQTGYKHINRLKFPRNAAMFLILFGLSFIYSLETFAQEVNDIFVKDDTASVYKGESVEIDVLENDTLSLFGYNFDEIYIYTNSQHGDVAINGDSSSTSATITYTNTNSSASSDSFQYVVIYEYRITPTFVTYHEYIGSVNVTVQNRLPTISPILNATVDEDAANHVIDLSQHFSDQDGDTISYDVENSNSSLLNTSLNGDVLTIDFNANAFGSASIIVVADDGSGTGVTDVFTVTVNSVNDAPVASGITATINEDASVTNIYVLWNDSDVDGDTLTEESIDSTGTIGVVQFTNGQITYDPNGQFEYLATGATATDTFTYTVSDGNGGTDTATVTVSVSGENDAPVIDNLPAVSMDEDANNVVIDLASYITDIDDDPFTITQSNSNTSLLSASISGTELTVDVKNNKNGSANITLTANDGNGGTATDILAVTVNSVNDTPTANNKSGVFTVNEDASALVLNMNDYFDDVDEADGDTLDFSFDYFHDLSKIDPSMNGAFVTINFKENISGTADFTIKANDDENLSVTRYFFLTINPVNDSPEASDFSFVTDEDTPFDFSPLISLHTSDVEGFNPLSWEVNDTGSLNGTISGSEYTPDENYHGTASFEFRVSDGNSFSEWAVVNIMVNPVNDAPTLVEGNGSTFTVDEDSEALVIDMCKYFYDVDEVDGDSLDYWIELFDNSKLNPSLNGSILTINYKENKHGHTDIQIKANDDENLNTHVFLFITINPVNDAPELTTEIADITVEEDVVDAVIDLSNHFSDIDGGTLTYTISNSNVSLVTTSISGDSLTLDFVENSFGTGEITITAEDSGSITVSDTFSVTVNPVNDAPTVANAVTDIITDEDSDDIEVDISNVFTDVDDDALSYSIENNNSSIVESLLNNGVITLTFVEDQFGSADITITATDGDSASVTDRFTVTVNPVNDAPTVIALIDDITVNEDAGNVTVDLSPYFADIDDATLTYNASNTNIALVTTTITDEILTLNFVDDQNGTTLITITAMDGEQEAISNTFTVTVNPVEDAPKLITPFLDFSVDEDAEDTVIDLSLYIAEVDEGDSITYSAVYSQNTASFNRRAVALNVTDASLTISYNEDEYGLSKITVTATDQSGDTKTDSFLITINPVTDPITLEDGVIDIPEGSRNKLFFYTQYVHNVDNISATYELLTGPEIVNISFQTTIARFRATSTSNFFGEDSFQYRVTDALGNIDQATLTLNVYNVQDKPVVYNLQAELDEDTAAAIVFNGTDVDNEPFTFFIDEVPAYGSLSSIDSATVIYTPNEDFNGTDAFTYYANDGIEDSATKTVSLNVNPVNDAPVAFDDNAVTDEDVAISGNVLTNDTENDSLTATLVSNASNGLLVLNVDGTFSYTPDTNFNGTDSFTYKSNDGTEDSEIAPVTITVYAVVDPVTLADGSIDIPEGVDEQPFSYTDLVNNPDNYDLTFEQLTDPEVVTITAFDSAAASLQISSITDFFREDSIQVRVTDELGNEDEATLTLNIYNVPDGPIAEAIDVEVPVNQDITFFLKGYDPDNGYGDVIEPVTYSVSDSIIAHGTLELLNAISGEVQYTPNVDSIESERFEYTVTSGIDSTTAEVEIAVINTPPVELQSTTYIRVDEDAPDMVFNLDDYFAETDTGDFVTYSIGNGFGEELIAADLTDNLLTVSFKQDQNGEATVLIVATDKFGAISYGPFDFSINWVNDAPFVANSIDDVTVNEDSGDVDVDISGVFDDVEGHNLYYTIENSNNSVVESSLDEDTNLISLAFAENQYGTAEITVTAYDVVPATATETFIVTVNPVNDKPVTESFDVEMDEDSSVNFAVSATDPDELDSLTYFLTRTPNFGTLVLDEETGNATYTPDPDFDGNVYFTYRAFDGTEYSNYTRVDIKVKAINDAPVAGVLPFQTGHNITTAANKVRVLVSVDLDGDGDIDALTAEENGSEIVWLANDGAGNFTEEVISADANDIKTLYTADINGDNDTDIIAGEYSLGQVVWFENDGLSFIKHVISDTASNPFSVITSGLDSDGDLDVLSSNTGNSDVVWYENDAGSFGLPQTVFSGEPIHRVSSADLDGDGDNDVITSSSDWVSWHQNDNGTFTEIQIISSDEFAPAINAKVAAPQNGGRNESESQLFNIEDFDIFVTTTDFDTDGDVDVIAGQEDRYVFFFENSGDGQFTTHEMEISYLSSHLQILDFDSDGDTDFLSTAFDVLVLNENIGNNNYDVKILHEPDSQLPIAMADIDGDGDLNLFSANNSGGINNVLWYENGVVTDEDTPLSITLSGSDIDDYSLTYEIVTQPIHGSVSGDAPNLTYNPDLNYHGTDSLIIKANDGDVDSEEYTVIIEIDSVNDVPAIVEFQDIVVDEDAEDVVIDLSSYVTDVEGDLLTYSISSSNATLLSATITDSILTLDFLENQFGVSDLIVFASDGELESSVSFTATVNAVNDAPIADATAIAIQEDSAVEITITASDVENDPLTLSLVDAPANGRLEGNIPTFTYYSNLDFEGIDTFTFIANDGELNSATVIVSVTVEGINDAPSFQLSKTALNVMDSAGPQTLTNFAKAISPGSIYEASQTVSFHVTTNNNDLFSVVPFISTDGILSYEPMPGTFGNAEVSITLVDDGGTENGGIDISETQSLFIIVEGSAKLLLLNSSSAGIAGATAQYQLDGTWLDLPGATDINGELELPTTLEGKVKFRLVYNNTTQTITQNLDTAKTVLFQTIGVTVELVDSTGAYITSGSGDIEFNRSGWQTFGSTGSIGMAGGNAAGFL